MAITISWNELWRIPIRQHKHILIINYKTILRKPKLEFFITYITRRVLYVHHISLPTDTMLEKDFQNSKYLEMYGKTKA